MQTSCYGLNVVCSPNSYVVNLMPKVLELGGGPFIDDWVMSEISVLLKEPAGRQTVPRDTRTLISDLQLPEL